jgi:trypsin
MVPPSRSVLAALGVLLVSAVGCARIGLFRAPKEPATQPAALEDESRAVTPDVPLALSLADDYVVRVVAGQSTCSGTLIDGQRVLTAHHCITERDKFGEIVTRDLTPEHVRVELGGDYLPWGEVGVRAIVAPTCGHRAGEGDIAVLVLERRLVGVPTMPTALDRAPIKGDKIEPVGFGRCDLTLDGIRRKRRAGGPIETVAPGHFRLRAAICPGDSGGPALTSGGKLVGVVSASAMDGDEATLGKTEFTRLDRWRPVFANSELIAEGTSPAELPPIDCSN